MQAGPGTPYPQFRTCPPAIGYSLRPGEITSALLFAELNLGQRPEKDSKITPILLDDELALSGKQAEAARNLETFLAKSPNASVPDYYLAAAWLAVGNNEKAQTYLERAFQVSTPIGLSTCNTTLASTTFASIPVSRRFCGESLLRTAPALTGD